MAAVVVQSVTGATGVGNNTGLVINFSAAVAGNLLIWVGGADGNGVVSNPPITGWTRAKQFAFSRDVSVGYKIAAGGETSVTITSPQYPTAVGILGVILEVSGLLTAPVTTTVAIANQSGNGDPGVVNNWPTSLGETSTPTADSFLVMGICAQDVASEWTNATADNSFTVHANCITCPASGGGGTALMFVEADGSHGPTNFTETITGNASPASGTPEGILVGFQVAAGVSTTYLRQASMGTH